MTIAFLFPGQGAQSEGLLHHLPQHAEVTRTIEEASDVLGVDIAALDNSEALHSTAAVQPALLIAGVATARALMAEHVHPAAVAGMSIGAFGAAVTCGTLSFADAFPLVRLRGELMQEAFPSGYGLAAIEGLDEVHVEGIMERIRTAEFPVYVSNINAPRQIVVAGSDAALDAATAQARQQGARRAERLAVSVPSHCPLLQPVADRLAATHGGARPEAALDPVCEQSRRSPPLRCRGHTPGPRDRRRASGPLVRHPRSHARARGEPLHRDGSGPCVHSSRRGVVSRREGGLDRGSRPPLRDRSRRTRARWVDFPQPSTSLAAKVKPAPDAAVGLLRLPALADEDLVPLFVADHASQGISKENGRFLYRA